MAESKSAALPLGYAPTASEPQGSVRSERTIVKRLPPGNPEGGVSPSAHKNYESRGRVQDGSIERVPQARATVSGLLAMRVHEAGVACMGRHRHRARRVAGGGIGGYKDASLASVGLEPAPSRALFSGNTADAALAAAAARVATGLPACPPCRASPDGRAERSAAW